MKIDKDNFKFVLVLLLLALVPITWMATLFYCNYQKKQLDIKHINQAIERINDEIDEFDLK
ncbi:hypothetical protein FDB61_15845 [Clostridium botulinum]|nr:hypothetical protein [Clostridium botulinum]